MNDTDILSIILATGTGLLGMAVSFIQYIISRRSEEKEIEIKYNINSYLHGISENGAVNDNTDITEAKEGYLNRLLESYHHQALQQANIQFWFSIIASTLGFAFIFVVISMERATNFFKELNYDNKIEKSIDIADTIENHDLQSDIKARIALHIIGISDNDHKTKDS